MRVRHLRVVFLMVSGLVAASAPSAKAAEMGIQVEVLVNGVSQGTAAPSAPLPPMVTAGEGDTIRFVVSLTGTPTDPFLNNWTTDVVTAGDNTEFDYIAGSQLDLSGLGFASQPDATLNDASPDTGGGVTSVNGSVAFSGPTFDLYQVDYLVQAGIESIANDDWTVNNLNINTNEFNDTADRLTARVRVNGPTCGNNFVEGANASPPVEECDGTDSGICSFGCEPDCTCSPEPECTVVTENADCDDSNVCTDDSCVEGSCVNTNNTASCDDGLFCTTTDTCSGGACVGSGDPCAAGETCNDASEMCIAVDIKKSRIKLDNANQNIPVCLAGSDTLDVETDVNLETLAFGSGSATPIHKTGGHFGDECGDSHIDILIHYKTSETGIAAGDTSACLTGLLDGTPFEACETITTMP